MKPCNKSKKEICTKEEEDIFIIWKRKKISKFINKQLRKRHIRLSKSSQTVPVFFVEKKDSKKYIV